MLTKKVMPCDIRHAVVKLANSVRNGGNDYQHTGVCGNLVSILNEGDTRNPANFGLIGNIIGELAPLLPGWSGNYLFPVSAPKTFTAALGDVEDAEAEAAAMAYDGLKHWEGEYGESRKAFLFNLETYLAKKGFYAKEIHETGSCLYHAVSLSDEELLRLAKNLYHLKEAVDIGRAQHSPIEIYCSAGLPLIRGGRATSNSQVRINRVSCYLAAKAVGFNGYSGYPFAPITHGTFTAEDGLRKEMEARTLWEGDYGVKMRQLLDFYIETVNEDVELCVR